MTDRITTETAWGMIAAGVANTTLDPRTKNRRAALVLGIVMTLTGLFAGLALAVAV